MIGAFDYVPENPIIKVNGTIVTNKPIAKKSRSRFD